jgi:hypothetical protein
MSFFSPGRCHEGLPRGLDHGGRDVSAVSLGRNSHGQGASVINLLSGRNVYFEKVLSSKPFGGLVWWHCCPPASDETGAVGREIKCRQGIE